MACSTRQRRGFALVIVLWVVLGASAVSLGASLVARDAVGGAANRVALEKAAWRAHECVERVRAEIDQALWPDLADAAATAARWNALDEIVDRRATPRGLGCHVLLQPDGLLLGVNSATDQQIARLLRAYGLRTAHADSLVAALADWLDRDDVSRPLGADGQWYHRQRLPTPRNGPLGATEELRRVRGFRALSGIDTLMGVQGSKVLWTRAPFPVLAALPGMTEEAARLVVTHRKAGAVVEPGALLPLLPAELRDTLAAHMAELLGATTMIVETWRLEGSASEGTPPVTARVELTLALGDRRVAVLRQRTWP